MLLQRRSYIYISQRIRSATNPGDRADGNRKQRGFRALIGISVGRAVSLRNVDLDLAYEEILMDVGTIKLDSAVSMLIGFLSLLVAAIQTIRLNTLRRLRIHRLRQDLVSCRQAVVESDRLHRKREEYGIKDPSAVARIRSIHANACTLTRSLFEQLAEVDKPYDASKIEQYVRLNLITSKWFWMQAALFVKNPSALAMPELPEDTPDYMEGASEQQTLVKT